MLYKLNVKDKQPETMMQKMDSVEDYLSFRSKPAELVTYNEAKNLIGAIKGGKEKRSGANVVWKNIKTEDVEDKKKKLLAQVEVLLANQDLVKDEKVKGNLEKAKDLLKPNPTAKEDKVLRNIFS
jgi:hypothetical protein